MDTVIETQGLTKTYGGSSGWRRNRRSLSAVDSVDLIVQRGELFGLLGPNGAGKTTLVKMLSTLILPSSGSAVVSGHILADTQAIRASVGLVVSDERSFYWRLSVRRNLDFFAAMHGLHGRAAAERIETVLAQVDLSDRIDTRFSALSSGLRQRLAIARSLLHRPGLLFLDEPSRSLDPAATTRLHDMLRQLMERWDLTIFLVTHDLAEAESLCHRIGLMHRGRIRAVGTPAELRRTLRPQRPYTLMVGKMEQALKQGMQTLLPGLEIEADGAGSQIRFQAAEDDGRLTAVLDYLLKHQVLLKAVEGMPPTLEEVFSHFTQETAAG